MPVRVLVAPVRVFADTPGVPIVFVVPWAVRSPVTPNVSPSVVAPVTPIVPPTVALLVTLADSSVARPEVLKVDKVVWPVTPIVPPTVALLVTLADSSVARPEVLKVDKVVSPVTSNVSPTVVAPLIVLVTPVIVLVAPVIVLVVPVMMLVEPALPIVFSELTVATPMLLVNASILFVPVKASANNSFDALAAPPIVTAVAVPSWVASRTVTSGSSRVPTPSVATSSASVRLEELVPPVRVVVVGLTVKPLPAAVSAVT